MTDKPVLKATCIGQTFLKISFDNEFSCKEKNPHIVVLYLQKLQNKSLFCPRIQNSHNSLSYMSTNVYLIHNTFTTKYWKKS
jgi:hypothetical protein